MAIKCTRLDFVHHPRFGAEFSILAFSAPAVWCCVFHSRIFSRPPVPAAKPAVSKHYYYYYCYCYYYYHYHYHYYYYYYHHHRFMATWTVSRTTRVSQYQKVETRKVKPN